MAARYLSASMSLENYADGLFEEAFTGHNDNDLADWLGMPIAGQRADIEFVENFHVPAEGDDEIAGTPADSEATILATEDEIQLMLYPRVIGKPTNMELSDGDPLRGNPRDVRDLSGRIQYELGRGEGFQRAFAASDLSMSRQGRSASRQSWRRKYCADDDDEGWGDDARLARRGRARSGSPDRARALKRRSL
eukprot:100950-Pyramimonas_sp.AAC.1